MLFRRVPTLYIVSIYYAIICIGTYYCLLYIFILLYIGTYEMNIFPTIRELQR